MYTLQNSTPLANSNASTGANAAEVVKFIRSTISNSGAVSNDSEPEFTNRSIDGYLKDEHAWKKTLDRRTQQKLCGFFAKPDCKYKECGHVELQNKNLVIESLGQIGNNFNTQVSFTPLQYQKINHFIVN